MNKDNNNNSQSNNFKENNRSIEMENIEKSDEDLNNDYVENTVSHNNNNEICNSQNLIMLNPKEDKELLNKPGCTFEREDANELEYFFCNCLNENKLELICYHCSKNCFHKSHPGKSSITGIFKCHCGLNNHKPTEEQSNDIKAANNERKCFFENFVTNKETIEYYVKENKLICQMCEVNGCYRNMEEYNSKKSIQKKNQNDKFQRIKTNFKVLDNNDLKKCECTEHNSPKLISTIIYELSNTNIDIKKYNLNFNINSILNKKEIQKSAMFYFFNSLYKFISDLLLNILENSSSYNAKKEDDLDENENIKITYSYNSIKFKFYNNYFLLSLYQLFSKLVLQYSSRNDYTMDIFDYNYINYCKSDKDNESKYNSKSHIYQVKDSNTDSNNNISNERETKDILAFNSLREMNSKTLKMFCKNFMNKKFLIELIKMSCIDTNVLAQNYPIEFGSCYFDMRFCHFNIMFDIYISSFIKNNSNTVTSSSLLNLTFLQRVLYLYNVVNFNNILECNLRECEDESIDSNTDKHEKELSCKIELYEFINTFIDALNEDMSSYCEYIFNGSTDILKIITSKSFKSILLIYINCFNTIIKYQFCNESQMSAFLENCFDIMYITLEAYTILDKESQKYSRIINKKLTELKKKGIIKDNRKNAEFERNEYRNRLVFDHVDKIDKMGITEAKVRESQEYIFYLIKALFVICITRNDSVLCDIIYSKFNGLEIDNSIKFVHENNDFNNILSRVFSLTCFIYQKIIYIDKEKIPASFLTKIPSYEYFSKSILELLIDDSQNYVRSVDLMTSTFNTLVYEYLVKIDYMHLNYTSISINKKKKRKIRLLNNNSNENISEDINSDENRANELDSDIENEYENETEIGDLINNTINLSNTNNNKESYNNNSDNNNNQTNNKANSKNIYNIINYLKHGCKKLNGNLEYMSQEIKLLYCLIVDSKKISNKKNAADKCTVLQPIPINNFFNYEIKDAVRKLSYNIETLNIQYYLSKLQNFCYYFFKVNENIIHFINFYNNIETSNESKGEIHLMLSCSNIFQVLNEIIQIANVGLHERKHVINILNISTKDLKSDTNSLKSNSNNAPELLELVENYSKENPNFSDNDVKKFYSKFNIFEFFKNFFELISKICVDDYNNSIMIMALDSFNIHNIIKLILEEVDINKTNEIKIIKNYYNNIIETLKIIKKDNTGVKLSSLNNFIYYVRILLIQFEYSIANIIDLYNSADDVNDNNIDNKTGLSRISDNKSKQFIVLSYLFDITSCIISQSSKDNPEVLYLFQETQRLLSNPALQKIFTKQLLISVFDLNKVLNKESTFNELNFDNKSKHILKNLITSYVEYLCSSYKNKYNEFGLILNSAYIFDIKSYLQANLSNNLDIFSNNNYNKFVELFELVDIKMMYNILNLSNYYDDNPVVFNDCDKLMFLFFNEKVDDSLSHTYTNKNKTASNINKMSINKNKSSISSFKRSKSNIRLNSLSPKKKDTNKNKNCLKEIESIDNKTDNSDSSSSSEISDTDNNANKNKETENTKKIKKNTKLKDRGLMSKLNDFANEIVDNKDLESLFNDVRIDYNLYNIEYGEKYLLCYLTLLYDKNIIDTNDDTINHNYILKAYFFFQDIIFKNLYVTLNIIIIKGIKLKGKECAALFKCLGLFLECILMLYSDKYPSFNLNNAYLNRNTDFYIEKLQSYLIFKRPNDLIIKGIKTLLNDELIVNPEDVYNSKSNTNKIKYIHANEIIAKFKQIFAFLYNRKSANYEYLAKYMNRYQYFESICYGKDDINKNLTNKFDNVLKSIKNIIMYSIQEYSFVKRFDICFNFLRSSISEIYSENLAIVNSFHYADLSDPNFLIESFFFFLLNKLYDNLTYYNIMEHLYYLNNNEKNSNYINSTSISNNPNSEFTNYQNTTNNNNRKIDKELFSKSSLIQRNLNNAFKKIDPKSLNVHNLCYIRYLRNITFNTKKNIQNVFYKYFEKNVSGVAIYTSLIKNFIFPFSIKELESAFFLNDFSNKYNENYELASCSMNLIQYLTNEFSYEKSLDLILKIKLVSKDVYKEYDIACKNSKYKSESLYYGMSNQVKSKMSETSIEYKDLNNKDDDIYLEELINKLNFMKFNFINMLFSLILTSSKVLCFEDNYKHEFQVSYFTGFSYVNQLINRTFSLTKELIIVKTSNSEFIDSFVMTESIDIDTLNDFYKATRNINKKNNKKQSEKNILKAFDNALNLIGKKCYPKILSFMINIHKSDIKFNQVINMKNDDENVIKEEDLEDEDSNDLSNNNQYEDSYNEDLDNSNRSFNDVEEEEKEEFNQEKDDFDKLSTYDEEKELENKQLLIESVYYHYYANNVNVDINLIPSIGLGEYIELDNIVEIIDFKFINCIYYLRSMLEKEGLHTKKNLIFIYNMFDLIGNLIKKLHYNEWLLGQFPLKKFIGYSDIYLKYSYLKSIEKIDYEDPKFYLRSRQLVKMNYDNIVILIKNNESLLFDDIFFILSRVIYKIILELYWSYHKEAIDIKNITEHNKVIAEKINRENIILNKELEENYNNSSPIATIKFKKMTNSEKEGFILKLYKKYDDDYINKISSINNYDSFDSRNNNNSNKDNFNIEEIENSNYLEKNEYNNNNICIYSSNDYFIKHSKNDSNLYSYPNFLYFSHVFDHEFASSNTNNYYYNKVSLLNKLYSNIVLEVEFVIRGELTSLTFDKQERFNYFDKYKLNNFYLNHADFNRKSTKISSLIEYINIIMIEYNYYTYFIHNKCLKYMFNFKYKIFDFISLIITLVIQILLMFTLNEKNYKDYVSGNDNTIPNNDPIDNDNNSSQSTYSSFLYYFVIVLTLIQVSINLIGYLFYLFTKYPVNIKKAKFKRSYIKNKNIYKEMLIIYLSPLLFYNDIFYMTPNIVIAILATSKRKFSFLFSLQLFTLLRFSEEMKGIAKSFFNKLIQLFYLIVFLAIFINMYSNIGFYFLNSEFYGVQTTGAGDFEDNIDDKGNYLLNNFILHFDNGQRDGGGIADSFPNQIDYSERLRFYKLFFYNMMYFIVIKLLLHNIINGIIVSAVSDLREYNDKKQNDMKNNCYICSLSRTDFAKYDLDFNNHIEKLHNVADYFNYFIYLTNKSSYTMTSTEKYILEKFNKKQVSLFPMGQTYDIRKSDDEDDKGEDMEDEDGEYDDE